MGYSDLVIIKAVKHQINNIDTYDCCCLDEQQSALIINLQHSIGSLASILLKADLVTIEELGKLLPQHNYTLTDYIKEYKGELNACNLGTKNNKE